MPASSFVRAIALAALLIVPACLAFADNKASPPTEPAALSRFILGSWVNVRAQPSLSAPVLDRLIVNTPVTTRNTDTGKDFLEITYGDGKHGFVAANLIGDKPVSLAEIGHQYDERYKPNPAYSATRSFWLQPTVDRLIAAGMHFEATALRPGEREAEEQAAKAANALPKLRRFAIPEFDAMKELLRKGVRGFPGTAHNDPTKPLAKWKDIKAIAVRNPAAGSLTQEGQEIRNLHLLWGYRDVPMAVIRELELPITKASYFRDVQEMLPPFAMTESVSAQFDIPYHATAKTGPTWIPAGHHNDGGIFGAWDVGAVETRLASPVYKHTLSRNGKLAVERSHVPGGRFPTSDADGNGCAVGFQWGDADAKLARAVFGTTKVQTPEGRRLFFFYTRNAIPTGKAKVIRNKDAFTAAGFIEAETLRFDLNNDGIDDILVWEGTGTSEQSIHDIGTPQAHYRLAFVNVGGDWHLLVVDEFLYGCGC